ncbi:MAG: hypothetical protein GXO39_03385 [Thermotogae bacterium]|nr:hypothetical protein [Thermotogota bacterium]
MIALIVASGFRLSFGTQSFAIGGVNYTLVSDYSAIYWNPALLADQRNSAGVDLLTIAPIASYQMNTNLLGYDGGYPRLKDNRAYSESPPFLIPSFGAVFYGESSTWGFAVFAPFGMGTKWDLYDPPINYYNAYDSTWEAPSYPKYDWESDFKSVAIWFGFGRELGPFRIGLATGPIFMSVLVRKVTLLDPATIDEAAAGAPIEYRLWPIDTKLKAYGISYGVAAGLTWYMGEALSLSFTGRYYEAAHLHSQIKLQLFTPRNDYIVEHAPDLAMLFSGYIFQGSGEGSTKLPLPPDIGLGLSFRPVKIFTLSLGFNYVFWSVLKDVSVDFDDLTLLYQQIKSDTLHFNWHNVFEVGVGTKLDLTEWLSLRFGFAYDQSPIPDSTFNPLIPDVGNRIGFSGGLSFTPGDFWTYNLSYTYTRTPEREISNDGYSYNAPYMPGKYSFSAHLLSFGVTYRW